jgi:hypothetical protein
MEGAHDLYFPTSATDLGFSLDITVASFIGTSWNKEKI